MNKYLKVLPLFLLFASIVTAAPTVLTYANFDPAGKALSLGYDSTGIITFDISATDGDGACNGTVVLIKPTARKTGVDCTIANGTFVEQDNSDQGMIITCTGNYGEIADTWTINMTFLGNATYNAANCTIAADTTVTATGSSKYGPDTAAVATEDTFAGGAVEVSKRQNLWGLFLGFGISAVIAAWAIGNVRKVLRRGFS